MPPLEIGFERFEENELDSATILKEKQGQKEEQQEQKQECRSTVDTMSILIFHSICS